MTYKYKVLCPSCKRIMGADKFSRKQRRGHDGDRCEDCKSAFTRKGNRRR